jgi:predicted PurR-regulated permease PerM
MQADEGSGMATGGPALLPLPASAERRTLRMADLALARAAVETVLRVGLLLALAGWCLWIASPFLFALVWGVIIAVAIHPGFLRMRALFGGRDRLAASLMAILILVILIGPLSMLTTSLVSNMSELAMRLLDGSLRIPAPPPEVGHWPIIGPKIEELWSMGSAGFSSVLEQVQPQLQLAASWLLATVAELGLGLLHFVAAVVVAGILLAHAEAGNRLTVDLATRLAGARGPGLATLTERTIRNVARGVIGTALVQAAAAGLGFVVASVPWPALLTLLCFMICLVQIGPSPILLGTVVWMYTTADAAAATIYLLWCVLVTMMDNVLRPLLIGRGGEVPLAVILLGVLGGLLAHGLIGLFVGPIVLALGHQLFHAWLREPEVVEAPPED